MPFKVQADAAAEFNRLCQALPIAIERAGRALRESSSGPAGYVAAAADAAAVAEVSLILARITCITNELN